MQCQTGFTSSCWLWIGQHVGADVISQHPDGERNAPGSWEAGIRALAGTKPLQGHHEQVREPAPSDWSIGGVSSPRGMNSGGKQVRDSMGEAPVINTVLEGAACSEDMSYPKVLVLESSLFCVS